MKTDLLELLIKKAREVSENAYSVYSNFPVGAAFIDKKGNIYTGCNVENKSFGLTNCAERTAIFHAISKGCRSIDTLVVYTPTNSPTPPCGACRQVITEFSHDAKIICVCDSDKIIETTINELIPCSEFPVDLRKG